MKQTQIEWTKSTINFWIGCSKCVIDREIDPACVNCYMFRNESRWGRNPAIIRFTKAWDEPEKAISKLEDLIFVNDMSDTFHENISFDKIKRLFDIFQKFPEKDFQILTKRIGRASDFFKWYGCVPENCWIGTSIGSRNALFRLDKLKNIDAYIRFISFEPLIEDLGYANLEGIDWIIIGGESDFHKPRIMHENWVENLIEQARRDNVAVFFKQQGGRRKCECCHSWGCGKFKGEYIREFPRKYIIKQNIKENKALEEYSKNKKI